MHLPLSSALVPRHVAKLVLVEECGSTNDELVRSAATEPDLSVLVTPNQTAGRGRLQRQWVAPAGEALAISVLVRPADASGHPMPVSRFGWLPLAAGLAMARAVATVVPPDRVGLKWPNDVQVGGLKVCGVLAEVVPGGSAIVVGAGVNLAIPADALPTPTSTSLGVEGARFAGDALADAVLAAYLAELATFYRALIEHDGDAVASGLRDAVLAVCTTLGRDVRVELPGDRMIEGRATSIDETGALVIEADDGSETAVSVGDVHHVRPV